MRKYIFHGLDYVLIGIILACQPANESTDPDIVNPKEEKAFEFSVDTVRLPLPGTTHEFPYLMFSLDAPDRDLFVGLDERENAIRVLNPQKMEYVQTIALHRSGPNAIPDPWMVGSIYYHNRDSIFILQHVPNKLLMINSQAEILWEVDIPRRTGEELEGFEAYSLFDRSQIYYYQNKIYFALRLYQSGQTYDHPFIGEYDVSSGRFDLVDITFPEYYRQNNLGEYAFQGISYFRDRIIVNYPYSAENFIYNLEGNLKKNILSHSRFKQAEFINKPNLPKSEHYKANPAYGPVIPSHDGQYFLQYGKKPHPEDPEKEVYEFTIVYNSDFTQFRVIPHPGKPMILGDEYFYYPVPQEVTDYQLLERYKIQMK